MATTTTFHEELDRETLNRLAKAAALAATAIRLGVPTEEITTSEKVREQILAEGPWRGATLKCWQMVVVILSGLETDR